jgi:hypothetical protein
MSKAAFIEQKGSPSSLKQTGNELVSAADPAVFKSLSVVMTELDVSATRWLVGLRASGF